MRADDSERGHAKLLRVALLDERHARKEIAVARVLALDLLEEEQVEVECDLHVTREKMRHQRHLPFLERW